MCLGLSAVLIMFIVLLVGLGYISSTEALRESIFNVLFGSEVVHITSIMNSIVSSLSQFFKFKIPKTVPEPPNSSQAFSGHLISFQGKPTR